MVTQTITKLIDDVDGNPADETIRFALDGVDYTIDLSAKNAGKLRKIFDPYITNGQRTGRTRPAIRAPFEETTAGRAAIRDWAHDTERFPDLGERGRIPRQVVDAWRAAADR